MLMRRYKAVEGARGKLKSGERQERGEERWDALNENAPPPRLWGVAPLGGVILLEWVITLLEEVGGGRGDGVGWWWRGGTLRSQMLKPGPVWQSLHAAC
jgi:hypothetical protein